MTKAKNNSGGFRESVRENLRALVTLVKMQLKEKMDLSYFRSRRTLIFKIVWLLIEFVAITAAISVVFYFVKILGLFSLVNDIPVSVISLVFAIMLLFSIATDTVGLMKSLYFSKDNTVLLTLPATPSLVFFSKLATYYVYEFRKSFMFTIPMFIAYGIIKGYGLYFYPWLLLMFALISTIPVLISALLSIPSMFIYVFLNRVKVLQYILYTAAAAAVVGIVWILIGLIPQNINFIETWGETYWQIQDFLRSYTEICLPIYKFTELIVGKSAGITTSVFHNETVFSLLILIAVAVLALVLCFVFSKPLFCRMAATPFEFKKNNAIKPKRNTTHSPFISALRKEWISGMRSNSFIKLFGILSVIMPTAIYLLNKLYSAMSTRFIGTQMTICFNVMIMLLILLMTNIDVASVYSRDGSSAYLNKVQPAPYATLLFSKLFFHMVIGLIGVIFTTVVFASFGALPPFDTAMLGVTVYAVFVAHMFSSAESDIMKPQYEQYATFNEQANNPNESGSAILAVILSAVVFIVALFLSSSSTEGVWAKLAVVAIVAAGAKAFTYVSKIKAFYKENQ
ncbi:MAG: hypothetical protein J6Q85_03120 [Clostridia bacterium]|nr:hypothetical protein [Clostridia bacterium]